jgi:Signal peptidase, peptidase S26
LSARLQTGISDMDGEMKSYGFPRWVHTLVIGRRPKRTLLRIAVLVVTTFVVFKFIVIPIRVEGISMSPNYRDGSINFINRLAYSHSKPRRGDVVGVRLAGEHLMFMKRNCRAARRNGFLSGRQTLYK